MCFPYLQRRALVFEGTIFIAEEEGKIVGAIKGKVQKSSLGSVGSIQWLMIHSDHQSLRARSITRPLMKELLDHFDRLETKWQLACVDVANTASSRGVEHFGFQPAGLKWIWRNFGLGWPSLAYGIWHLVDIGQVLWVRGDSKPEKEGWSGYWLMLLLFWTPLVILFSDNLLVWIMGLGLLLLRDLPQHFLKGLRSEGAEFRGFDSGLIPMIGFALLGQWFPYFGIWISRGKDNRRKRLPLARAQLAGLTVGTICLIVLANLGSTDVAIAAWQLIICLPAYLFFELLFPFFPFKGSIGNRVRP